MPTLKELVRKQKAINPIAAGVCIRAADTGRVLMLQRGLFPGDDAGGTWEFPGGRLNVGESAGYGAIREWCEEVGFPVFPGSFPRGQWDGSNGKYQGFVYEVPSEESIDLTLRESALNPDGDKFEAIAWVDPKDFDDHNLRPELLKDVGLVRAAMEKRLVRKSPEDEVLSQVRSRGQYSITVSAGRGPLGGDRQAGHQLLRAAQRLESQGKLKLVASSSDRQGGIVYATYTYREKRLKRKQKTIGNIPALKDVIASLPEEVKDGLEIYVNEGPPKLAIIDLMDWWGSDWGKEESRPYKDQIESAVAEWLGDESRIVWQNEGGKPSSDAGWERITKSFKSSYKSKDLLRQVEGKAFSGRLADDMQLKSVPQRSEFRKDLLWDVKRTYGNDYTEAQLFEVFREQAETVLRFEDPGSRDSAKRILKEYVADLFAAARQRDVRGKALPGKGGRYEVYGTLMPHQGAKDRFGDDILIGSTDNQDEAERMWDKVHGRPYTSGSILDTKDNFRIRRSITKAVEESSVLKLRMLTNGMYVVEDRGLVIAGPIKGKQEAEIKLQMLQAKQRDKLNNDLAKPVDNPNLPGMGEDVGGDVQDTALNGAQISSLLEVVGSVASGMLSPESAKAMLKASFPIMNDQTVNEIVDNIEIHPETTPVSTEPMGMKHKSCSCVECQGEPCSTCKAKAAEKSSFRELGRTPKVGDKVWILLNMPDKVLQGTVTSVSNIDNRGFGNTYLDVQTSEGVKHVNIDQVFDKRPRKVTEEDEYGKFQRWKSQDQERSEFASSYYDMWIAPVKRQMEQATGAKKQKLKQEIQRLMQDRDRQIEERFGKSLDCSTCKRSKVSKSIDKGQFLDNEDEETSVWVMTTGDVDRDHETVNPLGGDYTEFDANPVVVDNHSTDGSVTDVVLGRVVEHWDDEVGEGTKWPQVKGPKRDAHLCKIKWNTATPKGQQAAKMARSGMLNGGSISFAPLDTPQKNKQGGNHYNKWKLLEFTICPVGSNPSAVRLKSMCEKASKGDYGPGDMVELLHQYNRYKKGSQGKVTGFDGALGVKMPDGSIIYPGPNDVKLVYASSSPRFGATKRLLIAKSDTAGWIVNDKSYATYAAASKAARVSKGQGGRCPECSGPTEEFDEGKFQCQECGWEGSRSQTFSLTSKSRRSKNMARKCWVNKRTKSVILLKSDGPISEDQQEYLEQRGLTEDVEMADTPPIEEKSRVVEKPDGFYVEDDDGKLHGPYETKMEALIASQDKSQKAGDLVEWAEEEMAEPEHKAVTPKPGTTVVRYQDGMKGRVAQIKQPPAVAQGRGTDIQVRWEDGTTSWVDAGDVEIKSMQEPEHQEEAVKGFSKNKSDGSWACDTCNFNTLDMKEAEQHSRQHPEDVIRQKGMVALGEIANLDEFENGMSQAAYQKLSRLINRLGPVYKIRLELGTDSDANLRALDAALSQAERSKSTDPDESQLKAELEEMVTEEVKADGDTMPEDETIAMAYGKACDDLDVPKALRKSLYPSVKAGVRKKLKRKSMDPMEKGPLGYRSLNKLIKAIEEELASTDLENEVVRDAYGKAVKLLKGAKDKAYKALMKAEGEQETMEDQIDATDSNGELERMDDQIQGADGNGQQEREEDTVSGKSKHNKRISKAHKAIMQDATETLDDVVAASDTPKRLKSCIKGVSDNLKGIMKEAEPVPEEMVELTEADGEILEEKFKSLERKFADLGNTHYNLTGLRSPFYNG